MRSYATLDVTQYILQTAQYTLTAAFNALLILFLSWSNNWLRSFKHHSTRVPALVIEFLFSILFYSFSFTASLYKIIPQAFIFFIEHQNTLNNRIGKKSTWMVPVKNTKALTIIETNQKTVHIGRIPSISAIARDLTMPISPSTKEMNGLISGRFKKRAS